MFAIYSYYYYRKHFFFQFYHFPYKCVICFRHSSLFQNLRIQGYPSEKIHRKIAVIASYGGVSDELGFLFKFTSNTFVQ